MSKKPDGNSAFPIVTPNMVYSQGMTLRDYFAAEAMSSLVQRGTNISSADIADMAYGIADMMLRARAKGDESA